jgi:hypothetical protein
MIMLRSARTVIALSDEDGQKAEMTHWTSIPCKTLHPDKTLGTMTS